MAASFKITVCDLKRTEISLMSARNAILPLERIEGAILMVRDQRVLLDRDLAALYGVETRVLNQAVRHNLERFPTDFMFQLKREEIRNLSQSVISSGFGREMGFRTLREGDSAPLPPTSRHARRVRY